MKLFSFLFLMQGQCKPFATPHSVPLGQRMQRSSLYAEVQPVLAISIAKLLQELQGNKKWSNFFVKLLRQRPRFATKEE